MSLRLDVLLWAQRIVGRRGVPAHQLLEIAADASIDDAQDAFHKIARMAHPDLHRGSLTIEELGLVTTAYARVAAAYQEIRSLRQPGGRSRPLRTDPPPPMGRAPSEPGSEPPRTGAPAAAAAQAMSSKALVYYRKAELCLRRGELRGAVLQLKMAIAADPQSAMLRAALTEVEAEVGKKP